MSLPADSPMDEATSRAFFEAALRVLSPDAYLFTFARDKTGRYRAEYVERSWQLWKKAYKLGQQSK